MAGALCVFFLCTQMLGGPHPSYEPYGVLEGTLVPSEEEEGLGSYACRGN